MLHLDTGDLAALVALEADIRSPRRAIPLIRLTLRELALAGVPALNREVEQVAWEQLLLCKVDATTALAAGARVHQEAVVYALELHRRLTTSQPISV